MALQKCGNRVNRTAKELQSHGTLAFPCAGYASYYTKQEGDVIPWHWHEELELIYIVEGILNLKTPYTSFCVGKGAIVALNGNVLHYAKALEECKIESLVFHAKLIIGDEASIFAKRYLLPLISCRTFTSCILSTAACENLRGWFYCAFEALKHERFGFEFTIRDNLSHICLFLYQQVQHDLVTKENISNQEEVRLKSMLTYIHKHFHEPIQLAEIANAAYISERECLRCFQTKIHTSPMQYVVKYRIMQGADLLLMYPAHSIAEIAVLCGFDSASNFTKKFKRFYQCTPRDYRQKQQEQLK